LKWTKHPNYLKSFLSWPKLYNYIMYMYNVLYDIYIGEKQGSL